MPREKRPGKLVPVDSVHAIRAAREGLAVEGQSFKRIDFVLVT